ncbi:unnamed protein product [Linum tenue]|uniref:Uncharacterized protein n=1 Tax=Linum tenue TaxID=586396 RepID=A0AAV0N5R4_9ROSI|nr:unnamed protein product [Linum tenue]
MKHTENFRCLRLFSMQINPIKRSYNPLANGNT